MTDFRELIKSEAEIIARLHRRVYETCLNRKKDKQSWEKACLAFHSYTSELNYFLNRVYSEKEYADAELLEFVIVFLELNPMFFRSGYIKEEILRKIKRLRLTKKQADRLRNVLYDAVECRGTREFKAYCRLAVKNSLVFWKILFNIMIVLVVQIELDLCCNTLLLINYPKHDIRGLVGKVEISSVYDYKNCA